MRGLAVPAVGPGFAVLGSIFLTMISMGCSDSMAPQCICTAVFVSSRVRVVDEAGLLVDSVQTTSVVVRTGDTLVAEGPPLPGLVTVADDSHIPRLRSGGDSVRVTGSKATRSFAATFVVGTDDCRCHVRRFAGPDTVVIR
jgi:hypothetical protein